MIDIQFYYLAYSLERVLPKLLEKSLQGGFKTLVRCASQEKAEALAEHLWTYDPNNFLPHGTAKDGNAESQPIYLTAENDNPNHADVVIVVDAITFTVLPETRRVLELVDSKDEHQLSHAQTRLKAYQTAGHTVSCVRQTASGAWEKQAI